MAIFKDFLEWLLSSWYLKKIYLSVESVDPGILVNYHDSLGWYLEQISKEGKLPPNINYLSTIGSGENRIMVYFDQKKMTQDAVVKYINELGVRIKS